MRIKNNVCGAASSSLEISNIIVHFCVLLKKESMYVRTHMNIYVVSLCPMDMILSSLLQMYFFSLGIYPFVVKPPLHLTFIFLLAK